MLEEIAYYLAYYTECITHLELLAVAHVHDQTDYRRYLFDLAEKDTK